MFKDNDEVPDFMTSQNHDRCTDGNPPWVRLLSFQKITDQLPKAVQILRAEASSEGFRFMDKLHKDWSAGTLRFQETDECLLIVRWSGELAGIGGLTIDPADPMALRMRRFFVRQKFRRKGIARLLVTKLLKTVSDADRMIFVNAGTEAAPRFWESLGFQKIASDHHTHMLVRNRFRL